MKVYKKAKLTSTSCTQDQITLFSLKFGYTQSLTSDVHAYLHHMYYSIQISNKFFIFLDIIKAMFFLKFCELFGLLLKAKDQLWSCDCIVTETL